MTRLIKRCRFAGTQYWRFDEDEMHVELDYPRDMSMWRGIGYDIDSAFQYKDGNFRMQRGCDLTPHRLWFNLTLWNCVNFDLTRLYAFAFIAGKTYFFKGKGYWQFDDYRMRVAHEQQRKSAARWMGCRATIEDDSRQYLKNPKRDEETEDVNDDEEDMYFELELTSMASSCNQLINIKLVMALLISFTIKWGLT